jgi:hypothetical protein
MAKKYFRYVPDFDYVSRLPGSKNISDYVETKNLFRRGKIRPDIFNDLSYFTKYKIIGDERPDNVAYKLYSDENLDWLIMLSNNIINPENEWPLSQQSFDNYLLSKYGSYENIYNTHHYETQEVKNSSQRVILQKGLEVPQDFSVTFYDSGRRTEVVATNVTDAISNYEYENRIQENRRNIFVLKPFYLNVVIEDIQKFMPYPEGSSQYVDSTLVRGENIRLYN